MKAESHLLSMPLRELGGLLRQGECSPVQLAELALDALVRRGGRYHCVVTLTRERALRQARQAEAELKQGRWRGPLHGIPYGAKDLLATGEGIPTTWGMAPLKEQVFTDDAAALRKLEEAGAVLVAKLAMVEVAGGLRYDQAHASFTGPGINPWNPEAWTGGSSSGSAAAVAAGLVPFAIGSETWGSITSPSAFCGVTGLRPTLGRVSRRGCMALSWTLDKLGPLAHGADDCGLVLEALAGPDARDPACLPEPWFYRRQGLPARRLRLARLEGAEVSAQPEVPANFERALRVVEQGATVEVARLPALPYTEVASLILFSEASAAFDGLLMDGAARELAAEETHPVPLALRNIPAKDYINALRLRQRMQREVLGWLSAYDALVTPTIKRVAPPLDTRFSQYFGDDRRQEVTTMGNLLGLPALTVPTGFGQRGLPTALQFVGAPGSENLLLALAEAYQQRTDWHRRLPPA